MKTGMGTRKGATEVILSMGILALGAGTAYAATGSEGGGLSIGAMIFLGLFALIILAQLLPGLVLFGSLLTALFTRGKAQAPAAGAAGAAGGTGANEPGETR